MSEANLQRLPRETLNKLRFLVRRMGEDKAAKAIGVARTTVMRARGGLPLYRATRALFEQRIAALMPTEPTNLKAVQ